MKSLIKKDTLLKSRKSALKKNLLKRKKNKSKKNDRSFR